MNYLIVQEWNNTRGNHAGMKHMCEMLKKHYPLEYKVICIEEPKVIEYRWGGSNYLSERIRFYCNRIRMKTTACTILLKCWYPIISCRKKDRIFLLEYLLGEANQDLFARWFRRLHSSIPIYAMVHLAPTHLIKRKTQGEILLQCLSYVDKILTLGSSLSKWLVSQGVLPQKISTGFHYVDSSYYFNDSLTSNKRLKIISMGAMQRNYDLLAEIVNKCDNVDWIICRGRKTTVDNLFEKRGNIIIKGYLEEDDLRQEMANSDLSISIMDDTVGSNVITTSLSMGLINIVSDVGSIRDYCDSSNSIFCENTVESFFNAIEYINRHRNLIPDMQKQAIAKSRELSIENVHKWFSSI